MLPIHQIDCLNRNHKKKLSALRKSLMEIFSHGRKDFMKNNDAQQEDVCNTPVVHCNNISVN